MAVGLRVNLFFAQGRSGFSEVWHLNEPGGLTPGKVKAYQFAMARLALSGKGVSLLGIRVTDLDVTPVMTEIVQLLVGGSQVGEVPVTALGLPWINTPDVESDPSDRCLVIRCEGLQSERKVMYLRGVPDCIIRTGPAGPDFSTLAGYAAQYAAWRAIAQNGEWGWAGRDRTGTGAHVPILGYATQAGPIPRLGVQVNASLVLPVGTRVQVSRATALNRALTPNGQWTIIASEPHVNTVDTIYYLNGSEGINPADIDQLGKFSQVKYTFVETADVIISRQGSRKAGRPFGLTPGRRRVRR